MGQPLHVLIVEDNTDDALLQAEALRVGGYDPAYQRVDTAADMRAALAEGQWDLILADYALPHFSGPAALEVLRESGQDVPFIVVSATVTDQQAIDMMRAGASDFVLKTNMTRFLPAVQRELRDAIDRRERRHAQEALREERQRLEFVLEHSPDSIFIQDTDLRYIWVSTPAYPLTKEEYLGHTDFDILSPEDAQRLTEIKRRVIAEGDGITLELTVTLKGQRRTFEATFEPWRNGYNQVIGIAGYKRDITERKQAEETLERERAFLSSAIELLPFPIIFNTPTGTVIRANQASYRFFGDADPADWWDRTMLTADTHTPIPRERWPMVRSAHGEVISGFEGIIIMPGSQEVPIIGHSAPVYVYGQLVATVVAFMDISALKVVDRAKDEFLAVLSHELKTPLTSIIGWVQQALAMPAIIPEALRVIERNAQRQRQVLENLLDVSHIVTRTLEITPVDADLWQLAVDSVEEVTSAARERQLELNLEPPGEALPVKVDRERLQQAVENLLSNAIKFTDPGGTVTLAAHRADRVAVLTVSDTGKGIPPEALIHLFKPFQQIERSELTGGLGLGLAFVRGVIELHGGRVYAESAGHGKGSAFTIELPLREGAG
ncbi:MAG TPA: ATP-binding protein [Armatimonadota bacterium]